MTDIEMKAHDLTRVLFPELIKNDNLKIDFKESVESIISESCEEYGRL